MPRARRAAQLGGHGARCVGAGRQHRVGGARACRSRFLSSAHCPAHRAERVGDARAPSAESLRMPSQEHERAGGAIGLEFGCDMW